MPANASKSLTAAGGRGAGFSKRRDRRAGVPKGRVRVSGRELRLSVNRSRVAPYGTPPSCGTKSLRWLCPRWGHRRHLNPASFTTPIVEA